MTRTRRLVAVALGLVALLSACSKDGGADGGVVLDGRPRFPDQEGIVEAVSRTSLTLDGGRTYRVSPELQSFATQTMEAVPLLGREGQFVHVGLEDGTVVWFATIAEPFAGDPPTAYYTGHLVRIDDGRAIFRDGTVLRLGADVSSPAPSGFVQVEIDPVGRVVRGIALP